MSQRNGTVVMRANSFAEIASAVKSEKLKLKLEPAPAIDDVSIPDLPEIIIPAVKIHTNKGSSSLRAAAEQIKARNLAKKQEDEEQARIREQQIQARNSALRERKEKANVFASWMVEALKNIWEIETIMNEEGVGADLLDMMSDYERDDDKKLTIGQQRDEWRQTINRHQDFKDPYSSLLFIITEVVFWISVKAFKQHELSNELNRLVERKILRLDQHGEIRGLKGARFSLAERFQALDEEYRQELTQKVAIAVGNQVTRLREEVKKPVSQEADLTFEQFCEGVNGKALLNIPNQEEVVRGMKQLRPGGTLLVEIKDGNIFPVNGLDGIQKAIASMVEAEVFLDHRTLKQGHPPGWEGDFAEIMQDVMEDQKISQELATAYVRKMQAFWYLIQRGMKAKAKELEINALRQLLAEDTTLTGSEFYGINGEAQTGTVFLNYHGVFMFKGTSCPDLFMVVERSCDEEGVNYIEVIDAPEHVRKFLGERLFKVKFQEGEDFNLLPPLLERIFRAIKPNIARQAIESEAETDTVLS